MQIFYVSKYPRTSALFLADVHVRKQTVESCQMLANCYPLEQLAWKSCPRTQKRQPRKHSYYNHPCSKWVRQSIHHFSWLLVHGLELAHEYQFRFKKRHFCYDFLNWCHNFTPPALSSVSFREPPQTMPEQYKVEGNCVSAFRQYYLYDKLSNVKCEWTVRPKPFWVTAHENSRNS